MALVIRHALEIYGVLNNELDDKRVKNWLFMANPFKPIAIIGIYLIFVLKWGPKLMENRQSFKLDKIIKIYNLTQVVMCAFITFEAFRYTFARGYSIFCQPVDYSMEPAAYRIAQLAHYYFLTKVLDLIDTVFFVLKKKNSHVSFLHVYHHAGMVALTWIGTKYFAGGHSVFTGWINSLVHVIMYFYYFLTTVDNKYKQSFWKKYITQLQMIQFGMMALHWLFLLQSKDCGFPKFISFFMLPQNAFIFILFYDFYRKAYGNKKKTSEEEISIKKPELNNNIDLSNVKNGKSY
ncbi:hypothetical protein PVAND_003683 [Polypedilum vanderplanki]|uniref:Elongation of very long chain fatty acids protein n=1 Tax=Polypedilum vanderplanki TaxID=319348 RepID=A0A9J6BUT3_POLVA|nr:hypothetical protein PVAND_003683 [Polypedilum vanderplanki]